MFQLFYEINLIKNQLKKRWRIIQRSRTINSKIQHHKKLVIYWGDKGCSVDIDAPVLEKEKQCKTISSTLGVDDIVALKQIHSNWGFFASELDPSQKMFSREGDFIATNKKGLSLAIVTGDCIPIVMYNSEKDTLVTVHAGWKGAVNNIMPNVCEKIFAGDRSNLEVFIGPAALDCCYEVQKDFLLYFDQKMIEQCFVFRGEKIYYNNSSFVRLQLKNLGILERNIYTEYNICTMCSVQYCSYRRENKTSRRNVTIAFLR